jgi:hypothetical protein
MIALNRLLFGVLAGSVLVGCGSTTIVPDAGPVSDAGPTSDAGMDPTEKRYILDLTGSIYGGVQLGHFNNLAFTVNLEKPVQIVDLTQGDHPGILPTYDFAGCTSGDDASLTVNLGPLGAGDPAWVDYVDIEMLRNPPPVEDALTWVGGACFGYRVPGGGWQWHFETTPVTYDAATNRFNTRIPIAHGPIDALKIMFVDEDPTHLVTTVAYTARPAAAVP